MLPGLVFNGERSIGSYGKLAKGERVSVNLSTNQAAIAVGRTLHSSYDMYMCGGHGKCVEILHVVGDELWALGGKFSPPELGPPPHLEKSVLDQVMQDSDSGDDSDESVSSDDAGTNNHSQDNVKEDDEASAAGKLIILSIFILLSNKVKTNSCVSNNTRRYFSVDQ